MQQNEVNSIIHVLNAKHEQFKLLPKHNTETNLEFRMRGPLRKLSWIPILDTHSDTAAEQRKKSRIYTFSSFQTE